MNNKERTIDIVGVMSAYIDGKIIQCRPIESLQLDDKWYSIDNIGWDWINYEYRIQPTKVSFSFDAIVANPKLADMWFRYKFFPNNIFCLTHFNKDSVIVGCMTKTYQEMNRDYEYSEDFKTWRSCGDIELS